MKKVLLSLPLLATSFFASANTYINLGYGLNAVNHHKYYSFTDGYKMEPVSEKAILSVDLGYQFNQFSALEFGIQQFSLAEKHIYVNTNKTYSTELTAIRPSLKAIYLESISEKVRLKGGIGITATQYKMTGESPAGKDNNEYTSNRIGGVASLGFDYNLWQSLHLGLTSNFTMDSLATSSQFIGTVGYTF